MAVVAISDVVQAVIKELSQVTGASVQLYSEERIYQKVEQTFNLLFKEKSVWWDTLCEWFTCPLDGTTGKTTTDLSDIKDVDDIRVIMRAESDKPIPRLPSRINPFRLSGTVPQFVQLVDDTEKHFVIWPREATGTVYVHARIHPGEFNSETEVNFDKDVLVYGAAYQYAEDDGTNPGATAKFQQLFEIRRSQLLANRSNIPSNQNVGESSILDSWAESV